MAKQIAKQTMDKIMAGNFKGLNLSDCKLTLLGQISLAQQSIEQREETGRGPDSGADAEREGIEAMKARLKRLHVMLEKVEDRTQVEDETRKRLGTTKMGARLKSGNELEEWQQRQEYLRNNPEQAGSNVFTYKKNTHGRKDRGADKDDDAEEERFFANESLINEVQALRMKALSQMSGQPTRAGSQERDTTKWSYFEKLERLKLKVIQTHQMTQVPDEEAKCSSKKFTDFQIADITTVNFNRQIPNPDWIAAKKDFVKSVDADASKQAEVISFDDYFN